MSGPEQRPPQGWEWQAIGTALGLGFSIVGSFVLCIGGGVLLDRWLGTAPVFVLVGLVLGLATAGYALYELVLVGGGRRERRGRR
ncbi:MAG: AtpZ/AtpI family protein [Thermomicrobium sp.]|nr:AtpZ/AtpI family protein [Thermomicrobium sp.]MDW7981313.1 AtpZ/AtpI family protein [Thermomicrobium sp.]